MNTRISRLLFLLPILLLLLSACDPLAAIGPKSTAATPSICPPNSGCLTPYLMRIAYGVESLVEKGFTGKGQTVVDIVSFGSPTLQQDMDVFDKQAGLPAITLQIISPLQIPESDPHHDKLSWAEETTLDVQIIHAIAPDAKIVVLVSPVAETEGTAGLPEFLQLQQYVIDHHLGNIVSQSWGASEATLQNAAGQQEIHKWDAFYQKAATQGMTYFSSSGDNGAAEFTDLNGTRLSSVPTISFPADNPWVTSVGGTNLIVKETERVETTWNRNGQASGGGFSKFFPIPSYQKTLPSVSQFNKHRGIPDVAGDADPQTGLAYYVNGHWQLAGGTSASAPLWAGIMAIANQMAGHPLGFINPALYKLAESSVYSKDFYDITVGNNSNSAANVTGYSAVVGWDAATGWGSPNAEKLLPDLVAAIK